MKIIIIAGIQGSGKSTHAKKLQEKFGFVHVCAGELLRKHINEGTEFGKSYKAAYDRGELAPNEVTCGIMGDAMKGYLDETIILDGFPRNQAQLDWLEDNYDVVQCVQLSVPLAVATSRLLKRGRSDDTEEGIKKRFSIYQKETSPIIVHYSKAGKLINIRTEQSMEDTFQEIIDKCISLN